ncbi:MAG: hypothetical protein HRT94_07270 [Alphaproteobacteria bacterium]|nr:hypothetical protein [Alphaproteobacteria bacterium]
MDKKKKVLVIVGVVAVCTLVGAAYFYSQKINQGGVGPDDLTPKGVRVHGTG